MSCFSTAYPTVDLQELVTEIAGNWEIRLRDEEASYVLPPTIQLPLEDRAQSLLYLPQSVLNSSARLLNLATVPGVPAAVGGEEVW